MKAAICHYSYHRTWEKKSWSCLDLARAVASQGVKAIDFHVRYLGDPVTAAARVRQALDATGLELSGLSLSNNLNRSGDEFKKELETTIGWVRLAAEIEAPVSRIFGGHIADRTDSAALAAGFARIIDGLGTLAAEAKKYGVVLALENHGGLPCAAEEQIDVIRKINSANLRATVDIGNYMSCGQDSLAACAIAAPYAAYVHAKDFSRKKSTKYHWGWEPESTVLGSGDVDVAGCLGKLAEAGYDGYVALEYEASNDEESGVPESVEYLKSVLETM
jgi:sugar phosphate isomerase/epimerase